MQEIFKLLISIIVLIFGIFIGEFLARTTKEELSLGQKWFKLIIIISLISGFISLIFGNDILMFSFFFIAIVTSRSLNNNQKLK